MNDPEVIEEMATSRERRKPRKERLWGYTPMYSALRDLCDQLIAARGGTKWVPRPEIPGAAEKWRRKDVKLQGTIAQLTGQD